MEGKPNHPHRRSRPQTVSLSIALAAALWLIFVGTFNRHEMMVGAVCLIATVVFTAFTARTMGVKFGLRLRDFAEGWRIPWYVVSGVAEIVLVLIKDVAGVDHAKNLFRVCGFNTSKHDPVRIARTVLSIVYTTMAPNFIVIGVDQTQSRMLFHQIGRSSVPIMTKRLGAHG
jgi:hypothetical protein